jgi:hypothetical protein
MLKILLIGYGGLLGTAYLACACILGYHFLPWTLIPAAALPVCGAIVAARQASRPSASWKYEVERIHRTVFFFPLFVATLIGYGLLRLPVDLLLIEPVRELRLKRRERQFAETMRAQGRYRTLEELRPELEAGHGSLILECALHDAEQVRIWWTSDNVLSHGAPYATWEEYKAIMEGRGHHFNDYCLARYLDPAHGQALLTAVPMERADWDQRLKQAYPHVPVVPIIRGPTTPYPPGSVVVCHG